MLLFRCKASLHRSKFKPIFFLFIATILSFCFVSSLVSLEHAYEIPQFVANSLEPSKFLLSFPSHPFNQFKVNGEPTTPSWFVYHNKSFTYSDTHQTFNRFAIYPTVITSSSILQSPKLLVPSPNSFLVVFSSSTIFVRPNYHSWVQKTLDQIPEHSVAYSSFGDGSWIIISTRTLTLVDFVDVSSHYSFVPCAWSQPCPTHKCGEPFAPLKHAESCLFQAKIDSEFEPIKVISDDHFESLKPIYETFKTGYVFGYWSDHDQCELKNKEVIAGMILAVAKVRKFSNRRIILLLSTQCLPNFKQYFSNFKFDVEFVSFDFDLNMAHVSIFRNVLKYRAAFYLKSYYLIKINHYLGQKPLERIIYLDWDLYVQESLDKFFDLPVSNKSLLATSALDFYPITINGGLMVLSPDNDLFIDFWQSILSPYKGWSYFENSNILTHSEQETFLYYFRLTNQFYYLPPRYNTGIGSAVRRRNNGGDIDGENYGAIHFLGGGRGANKPHNTVKAESSVGDFARDFAPEFGDILKQMEELDVKKEIDVKKEEVLKKRDEYRKRID
ncbi:hypothetical protein GEMRC1_011107 [Eukaryota sp. GEM-RC1]